MIISKKITQRGGITIPEQLRAIAGIAPGAPVDIEADGSGAVIITKHVPSCNFCGSVEDVIALGNLESCAQCAEKLSLAARIKLEARHDRG